MTSFVCMIAYTNYARDARVRREAETLAASGLHVRCLTTQDGDRPTRQLLDGVEVRELRVRKYRGKSKLAYMASYVRFLLSASASCLVLLLKRQLDVVHAHNLPDFLVFAGLVPRLAGCKVVLDVHDSVPETFATKFAGGGGLHRLLCLEERVSSFVAHRVICVNHPQRDALVSRGIPREKTFISMNVPDPRIFAGSINNRRPEEHNGVLELVYHGTMARRLGVDLIVRAVGSLRDRGIPCRLHLWGHGDDLDCFQALARELALEDQVLFRPEGYPLHELPSRLRSIHVGVVGNRRSPAGNLMLPVKLLEYVSLGVPAVVPRLPTIAHYFSEDMVYYYDADDVDSLVACLANLRCRPEARRARADAAQQFLQQYGWDRQGSDLVGLYRSLVES